MSYRDEWVTCQRCGRKFVFTVEEQRRLGEGGREVVPPSLCPDCTKKEKPPTGPQESTVEGKPPAGPQEGTVKWYDPEKRYGFIVQRTGDEIFFHRSGIAEGGPSDLSDGTRVTYLVEQTAKGSQAVEVAPMDEEGS
jgi:CspA family cold shock protein